MSHIDAKAETKSSEVISEGGEPLGGNTHSSEIETPPLPNLDEASQRSHHAAYDAGLRFNCNGKSCGEFNCDTCHQQALEDELPLPPPYSDFSDEDIVAAKELERARGRGFGALQWLCRRDREHQLREALARISGLEQTSALDSAEYDRTERERNEAVHEIGCEMQRKDQGFIWVNHRAVKAEAELAALKATLKNTAQRINSLWTDKELLPCGCPAFQEYVYYNSETKHCHCVKCGDVYTHESQESSPSLPLEEPEQMRLIAVKDEEIAVLRDALDSMNRYNGQSISACIAESRRALAARRGGK